MNRYTVYVTPQVLREIKDLPGYMRQRVKKVIDGLEANPHPTGSKQLQMPESGTVELWRVRLDKWRIVYAITEADSIIDVLAVRKRPPYDYGDLEAFLGEV
jgi:mRNA interferase RelE/StbE